MSFHSICALALLAKASSSDECDGAGTCSDEATLLQSVSRHKIHSHENQPRLAAVQNENENCWTSCNRRGGVCDFCGAQGACCRQQGWNRDPWECGGLGGGIDGPHHSCRLALVPASEAAAFVNGEVGSDVCPTRDVNEEACLAAVQSLLPSDVRQGRAQLVAGSWGWVPPGCSVQSHFTHGRPGDWAAHYNRNPNGNNDGGYTPVCHNGYNFGDVASNECRDADTDEAECLAAAQSLLPTAVNQGRTHLVAGSWGWVPPGCSVQSHFTHGRPGDWAAHYNRNPNGNNDGGYTPVCMRPPSGEAEYVGCFVDDRSRDLGAMVGNTGASTNSFARCRERCGESIYMSLQFGGECFCADAYGTAPQYVMVDDAQCDSTRVPCSLNSHNCGGTWRQAIYMINPQCGGVYEAEDATHLVGATVHRQTDSVAHQGFTGQSFVDYTDAVGSVEWNVEHCGAGAASVSFRYALRGGDRPLEVEVNGEVVRAQLSFPPTGSWATWGRTDQVHIPLAAGANRIKLIGTGRSGANVDSMTLTTGTCADQGRYIRHDVGTAIYWEKCGVKYWVQSCSMCDNILDFAHTPCHNHWVDQPQSYIDSLLSGGGFGSADGERFQCSQHWAYNTEPTHDLTEPTHYLTVVSWPAYAWGEWNDDAKGPIQKCSPRDTTTDADGTGYMFTSCCTAEGVGMRRDCGTTHNTNFETAVEQCAAQGGRLCTADEVLSLDENSGRMTTVTQGCSVDGPRTASGGDLNRLWTSTPCSPCYTAVHDGHCATGWIRGSNTMRDSIESCFAQCDSIADCGYFAFSENSGTATNCALYTAAGGCEDDNNYPTYTAYQMSGGDCRRPDFPVLLDPKH